MVPVEFSGLSYYVTAVVWHNGSSGGLLWYSYLRVSNFLKELPTPKNLFHTDGF